jgi:hypothetical protein
LSLPPPPLLLENDDGAAPGALAGAAVPKRFIPAEAVEPRKPRPELSADDAEPHADDLARAEGPLGVGCGGLRAPPEGAPSAGAHTRGGLS